MIPNISDIKSLLMKSWLMKKHPFQEELDNTENQKDQEMITEEEEVA